MKNKILYTVEDEVNQYLSLRKYLYQKKLGLTIERTDDWDNICKYFLVRSRGEVIGGCRVIRKTRATILPMEADGVDVYRETNSSKGTLVAEISRLAIKKTQDRLCRVNSLFMDIEKWALENRIDILLAIMPKPQARLYARALHENARATKSRAIVTISDTFKQTDSVARKYNGAVDSMVIWQRPGKLI